MDLPMQKSRLDSVHRPTIALPPMERAKSEGEPVTEPPEGRLSVELVGPRVVLREPRLDDAPALLAAFGDPEVVRYMAIPVQTLETEQQYLKSAMAEAQRNPRREFHLAVALRASGAVIGMARISISSVEHLRGDVGYGIRRDLWNRGYTTEALTCLVNLASRSWACGA